ncbi:MAG: zinc-binding dehydrogenase [Kiritimatiellae bacterium]|nr:zinc-binding dehydrogenase [Kiritimatiellia bacterium]
MPEVWGAIAESIMKAAFFAGNGTLEIRDVPTPELRDGHVLVRIESAALCGSDLRLYRAKQAHPSIEGHENAGVVVESRSARWQPGQRVLVYALSGCLRCEACRAGNRMYCPDARSVIGGFGEYVAVGESDCLAVPEWMSSETAAIFGDCIGLPHHTLRRLSAQAGQAALIVGLGPVGLSMTMAALGFGLNVIGVEPNAFRRQLALRVGARHALDPGAVDIDDTVRRLTNRRGPDIAIDCAGKPATQIACMRVCRKGGHVGFVAGNTELTLNPNELFLARELWVVGNWYYNISDFSAIAEFARRHLDPALLVTHRFPLSRAQEAFDLFASGDSGKVVLGAD